jgi:hypothetical protein
MGGQDQGRPAHCRAAIEPDRPLLLEGGPAFFGRHSYPLFRWDGPLDYHLLVNPLDRVSDIFRAGEHLRENGVF